MLGHSLRPDRTVPRDIAILLVESDADNRDLYAEYLRYSFAAVATADTTDAALPLAQFADVIVTGIRVMGTVDGIGFVQRLRADEATKHAAIVVLTSCAFTRDERLAKAAGCDVFLRKPCEPAALVDAINRLMMDRTGLAVPPLVFKPLGIG